jgi:hypothetical protein
MSGNKETKMNITNNWNSVRMLVGFCTLSVFEIMWTKLQTGSVFVFWYGARKAGRRTVTQTGHCYWTIDTYDTMSREHDNIRPPSQIFWITKYEYWRFLVHCTHRYTHLFCTEFLYNTCLSHLKRTVQWSQEPACAATFWDRVNLCKIQGPNSSVAGDSGVFGCDAASQGE